MFFTLYFLRVTDSNILLLEKRVTLITDSAGLTQSTLAFDKDNFAHQGWPNQISPTHSQKLCRV